MAGCQAILVPFHILNIIYRRALRPASGSGRDVSGLASLLAATCDRFKASTCALVKRRVYLAGLQEDAGDLRALLQALERGIVVVLLSAACSDFDGCLQYLAVFVVSLGAQRIRDLRQRIMNRGLSMRID